MMKVGRPHHGVRLSRHATSPPRPPMHAADARLMAELPQRARHRCKHSIGQLVDGHMTTQASSHELPRESSTPGGDRAEWRNTTVLAQGRTRGRAPRAWHACLWPRNDARDFSAASVSIGMRVNPNAILPTLGVGPVHSWTAMSLAFLLSAPNRHARCARFRSLYLARSQPGRAAQSTTSIGPTASVHSFKARCQ